MIEFDAATCRDLGASARREWLETNGLGGFASSTMSCMNTRRYHALLVAAVRSPAERFVLLSKLEETLVLGDARYELSTNQYPLTYHPIGYRLQTGFRLDPFPIFTFHAGETEIEKIIFMPHGENTTVVRYRFRTPVPGDFRFEVRPLVAFRDYHSVAREGDGAQFTTGLEKGLVRIDASSCAHTLFLSHNAAQVETEGYWYRQMEYAEERARGFEYHEDLFNPCRLIFTPGDDAHTGDGVSFDIVASTEHRDRPAAAQLEADARERRHSIRAGTNVSENESGDEKEGAARGSRPEADEEDGELITALRVAADQFIIRRSEDSQEAIIAGYHWFTDWARDTMISLHGLVLATGRFQLARQIIFAFTEHLDQGLIPNRLPDKGEQPEYSTVDSTLWLVHAVGEYMRRTGDRQFVREKLYDRLREIIHWHERGTFYGIQLEDDYLLRAGEFGSQLTWMDARMGADAATPRTGKPVEIQALWYNALRVLETLAQTFGDERMHEHYRAIADGTRASFNGYFWNEEDGCLYDYIADDGTPDAAVRPNQIFAVSLPYPLVTGERARLIVSKVEQSLLTPYGLRTLNTEHEEYHGHYEGSPYERESAYHQGTVWSWLMGPFITAYLKVFGRTPETQAKARGWLAAFRPHLREAGLGQISEIFDGDPPHTPRGCIAQGWSVAEILRCELEEVS